MKKCLMFDLKLLILKKKTPHSNCALSTSTIKHLTSNIPCAFTLVEMLVTMTVSTTLLVLASGMIHQTMTLHTQGRLQGDRQRTALRLARQFRHDIQHSHQVSLQQDGAAMTLEIRQPTAVTVTYSTQDSRIVRDQPHANGQHQRELFLFAANDRAHFELLADPRRAALVVTHPVDSITEKERIELHVEAVAGRRQIESFTTRQQPAELPSANPSATEKVPGEKSP
ncbi:MAG: prepilin-type N-terminal cleavage/methylation domain-containing protein [Pirellulales bacterium]